MLKIIIPMTLLLLLSTQWQLYLIITITIMIFTLMLIPPHMEPTPMNPIMILDSLSFNLIMLTMFLAPLIIMASQKIFFSKKLSPKFLVLMFLLNFILMLSFCSSNIFMFYIMFEASLIPTLLIILIWGYQPERLQAGMYMMLYTISASLPLLLFICYIMYQKSPTNMMISLEFFHQYSSAQWVMMNLAFLIKLPMYISHLWLPKAHVEAPVAGSMILAGVLLKLGGYGLLRLTFLIPPLTPTLKFILMSLGLWGGALTSMICARQTDMKSLIAYSSVGHMSLVMAGAVSNSSWGLYSAMTMMLAHGLVSSALFAAANITYELSNSRNLIMNKGLNIILPSFSLLWFLLSAANMAAPPSINLLAEIMLITSTLISSWVMMIPISMMSFTAAAYSLILYISINHGPKPLLSTLINTHNTRNFFILLAHIILVLTLISSPHMITPW